MHYSATFGENVIICYHLANALIAFDTVAPECIMLDIARGILDCTIRRKCYHNVIILLSFMTVFNKTTLLFPPILSFRPVQFGQCIILLFLSIYPIYHQCVFCLHWNLD